MKNTISQNLIRHVGRPAISLILAVFLVCSNITGVIHVNAEQVFLDVSPTQDKWCYEQVMKAYNMGIIHGYGDGYFGKNNPITRGQIVQILYNRFGTDCGTDSGFKDVPSSMWCAKAIVWAAKNKIVSGYADGTFKPNDRLTREQMVKILYNVAGNPAVNTSETLSKFKDADKVAGYAVNGFAWAVSNGVVSGTSSTTLSPKGTATRAQVAVILVRYIEKSGR